MRKRLLSILLLCCMVLTLLPTAALAEETVPTFDLTKDLDMSKFIEVTAGTKVLIAEVCTRSSPSV